MGRDQRYLGQFRPEFSKLYLDRDLYWAVPFSAPRVIAVIGKRFAGVNTVIEYLASRHGYLSYTLGGELRAIAEERGVPVDHRRYLQDLGDQIRTETRDPAYLARRVLRTVRADYLRAPAWALQRSVVIGGLKTCEELEVISAMRNFRCLKIEVTDDAKRFERVLERGELEEEYEAERAMREADEDLPGEGISPWDELGDSRQKAYFDQLDQLHDRGHPGPWPDAFKGVPAKVIEEAKEPLDLRNDFDSMSGLHAEVDRVLSEIRPAQQIVIH